MMYFIRIFNKNSTIFAKLIIIEIKGLKLINKINQTKDLNIIKHILKINFDKKT